MLSLEGKRTISKVDITSDQEAQEMHEAAIREVVARILKGEIK